MKCPHCGESPEVNADGLGKHVGCPYCGKAFFATQPPDVVSAVLAANPYAAPDIASAVAGAKHAVRREPLWRFGHGTWIVAGVLIVALLLYAAFATRTEERITGKFRVEDTCRVWGGTVLHRRVTLYDSEEAAQKQDFFHELLESAGPVAGTGKPHGQWSRSFGLAATPEGEYPKRETVFYWYGEEISEGEWHLRNK